MFQPARAFCACAAVTAMLGGARAAQFDVGFKETKVAAGLTSPTAIAVAPDGRLFIAQQGGVIRLVKNDTLAAKPFAYIGVDDYGERGLLGLALDTAFSTNGFVYLFYSSSQGGSHNRVTRITASGDTALPGEQLLMRVSDLSGAYQWSHNGGGLEVGADGKLYIGVGDQEISTYAQDVTSPNGKILRINTDGSIPEDNPWAGTNSGSARAVWATGLRNPFKLGVDRREGKIYANDVGWGAFEEVNEIHKGANYGWDRWEGPVPDSLSGGLTSAAFVYAQAPDCAVMGGDVYRPEAGNLAERYIGGYFFVDFCTGRVRVLEARTDTARVFGTVGAYTIDLAFNRSGDLYYIHRGYATGYTSTGTSSAFKISFADSSGVVGVHSRASAPRASGTLLAWADGGRVRVPAGMTAVAFFDLSGRKTWEARHLKPGTDLALPAHLRGVSRVMWRER